MKVGDLVTWAQGLGTRAHHLKPGIVVAFHSTTPAIEGKSRSLRFWQVFHAGKVEVWEEECLEVLA